jgi:hypothetical protein
VFFPFSSFSSFRTDFLVPQVLDLTCSSPTADVTPTPPIPSFTCSICLNDCRPVSHPYTLSLEPSSSTATPFGLYVGPPSDDHIVCLPCAQRYVQERIAGGSYAFPTPCPSVRFFLFLLTLLHRG